MLFVRGRRDVAEIRRGKSARILGTRTEFGQGVRKRVEPLFLQAGLGMAGLLAERGNADFLK